MGSPRDLTLDLTANTDFAQAEADDQQINLTRFSLFFPEKRQFFQERSGIFDFRTGGVSRLFHSRRIGLTDTGEPVGIIGGGRMVGRRGPWDIGLMSLVTGRHGAIPIENFGVARMRRQVINPHSYAGLMTTSRVNGHGTYNVAYGLDSVVRIRGDDYLVLQWAQTFDSEHLRSGSQLGLNSARFTLEIDRRRRRGWGYNTTFARAGRLYTPGTGFTQRSDFTLLRQSGAYTWLPSSSSPLIWHTLSVDAIVFMRNQDWGIASSTIGPEWAFTAKSGAGGNVELQFVQESPQRPFKLADSLDVPAGDYQFWRMGASYHVTHTSRVQLRPRVELGSFYDGSNTTLGFSPIWYASPHLELSGSYTFSRIRFKDRGESLGVHLARIRVGSALNTKLSTNAFVQFNSVQEVFSANIRFRYNFREGNDLWIVFNTSQVSMELTPHIVDSQTVLVKYTYTIAR